jgi:flavin reductase (DIM6/NTAB) family NADH-FMN oxidoreductase RutF
MFYETKDHHGLPHSPFKSLIVPRPIGWISSLSVDGIPNLAPFSFFNGLSDAPPMVMFACNGPSSPDGRKDSAANVEATGEFVVNMATEALTDQMNASSATVPNEVNEFELAGLTAEPSELVKAPRVAESPAHMECKFLKKVDLPSNDPGKRNEMIIGEVIGIHIRDEVLVDGLVDVTKFRPLARLGYMQYTVVDKVFTLNRPG